MNTTPTQSKPRRTAPLIKPLPVAETHEVPIDDLTPFEFDSFFGSFFEPTVRAELAS